MTNSWYVEYLLRNRDQIRSNISEQVSGFSEPSYIVQLEDTNYNNLLLVEKKLKELYDNSQLSEKEVIIINNVLNCRSIAKLQKELGMTRTTITRIFSKVCDRIAYLLGYEFTDDGYLSYLGTAYHLNEEQLEQVKKYMASNKRNYNIRKKR